MGQQLDAQIDRDAEWAGKFKPTSLAQRQRYAEATGRGEDLTTRRTNEAEERLFLTNKTVQSGVLGRERIRQGDERSAQAAERIGMERDRMTAADRRSMFDQEIKQKTFEIREAQEKRAQAKALFDATNAKRITDDSAAAEAKLQNLVDSGLRFGTEEFARRTLGIIAAHPFMDKDVRASALGSARIVHDPESVETAFADLTEDEAKRTRWSRNAKGELSFSVGPEATTKPVADTAHAEKIAELKSLRTLRSKSNLDEDQKKYYDSRIMALESAATDTKEVPGAAEPAATKPAKVIQNGVTYTLQPDGSYQ